MARCRVSAAPRVALLGAAYVLYVLLGALVFTALEAPRERDNKVALRERLAALGSEAGNGSCRSAELRDALVALVVEARIYGVMGADGTISNLTNWDYNSAIFFAGTVVTTIGYGNLSPATVGGKVFCIIFATFGIPLNVVVLNKVGQVILRGLDWIAEVLRKKGLKKSSIRLLTTMAFVGLGFMIFVLFPAVIFMAVEGWSYTESYYFSFVTLSTIGFGDYVVGSNPSVHYTPLYKTMVAMWIIFGLAWLSAVFNAITALLERVGKGLARRDRRDLGSEGGIAIVDPGHPSHGDTTGDHGQMGEMGKEIHQVPNSGGETGGGGPIPGVSTEKGAIKDPGPGGGTEKDDLKDSGPGGGTEKGDLKDSGLGGDTEKGDLKDSGSGGDTEKGDLKDSGLGGDTEKGDLKDSGLGGDTEKEDLKDNGPGGDTEKGGLKDLGSGGGSEKEDLKDSDPGEDTEKGDLNASGPGGGVEKGDHGPEGGMENGGSVGSDTPDKPNLAEAQTERDDI
ncbi:potassium channel subfamily K member 17-like [Lethenteron reissneri]|uniref:potassium channel subfamily K member 17-like n=1 Tax=Lethenteron reissneri TaxID=7753 RepID=UPI002AB65C3F|nr:potassium channel subfamily K member 17-like [Lethenteron reissneri]